MRNPFVRFMRYFDQRKTLVEEVMKSVEDGTLTDSHEDLHRLFAAFKVATFRTFSHRVDGRRVVLETRLVNIDDFLVQLGIVNAAMERKVILSDLERAQPTQIPVSLYDFLVSNDGYSVPLSEAIKRSTIPLVRFLSALDEMVLLEDPRYQRWIELTALMRHHIAEVMLSVIYVSDQAKP